MKDMASLNPITAKLIIQKNSENFEEKQHEGSIVEQAIDKVLQLTHIRLDRCGITKIANLECFTSITNLYLQHNEISMIENLEPLQKLKFLCLSHNKISSINGLKNIQSLTFLDLSHNCIANFDIQKLPTNLIIIDVRDNECTMDAEHVFTCFPKLKQLNGHERSDLSDSDFSEDDSYCSEEEINVNKSEVFQKEITVRHENRMSILNNDLFVVESPRPLSSASNYETKEANTVVSESLSFNDVKEEIDLNVKKFENELKLTELKIKDMFEIRPSNSCEISKANYALDEFFTKYHEDERERLLEQLEDKLKKDFEERRLIVDEYTTTQEKGETISPQISQSPKSYQDNSSQNRSEDYFIVPRKYKSNGGFVHKDVKSKHRAKSAGTHKIIPVSPKNKQGSGLFSRPLIDDESNVETTKTKNLRPINYNYRKKTKENLRHFSNINAAEKTEINISNRIPMPPIESKRLTIMPNSSNHRRRSAPVTPVMSQHSIINPRIRTPGARPIDRNISNVFEIPH